MAERFRPRPAGEAEAEPGPQVEVETLGIEDYRRMLYDATAKGWPVSRAGEFVRRIQQETPEMYTTSFEPGSAEYERYYDLRRAGKTRREAFGAVLQEMDFDNPDNALTAREIQEGREAVMLPGGRQSFHAPEEAQKADKSAPSGKERPSASAQRYPTRREAMQADIDAAQRREKTAEAAKKASVEAKHESDKTKSASSKGGGDSQKKGSESSS